MEARYIREAFESSNLMTSSLQNEFPASYSWARPELCLQRSVHYRAARLASQALCLSCNLQWAEGEICSRRRYKYEWKLLLQLLDDEDEADFFCRFSYDVSCQLQQTCTLMVHSELMLTQDRIASMLNAVDAKVI